MGAEAGRERLVGTDRVLAVLIELAQHPLGVSLDELAQHLDYPKPTIHRALASLRRARLAAQTGRGRYVLGDEFIRLAIRNHEARPEALQIGPILRALTERFGETTHYAVLEGTEVVYRAKEDPEGGAIRLTSTVGGRNPAYRTAVGKLLLAQEALSEADLRERLGGEGAALEAKTPRTITSVAALWKELETTRARGFAVDDQENEVGVNCVAVPVRLGPDAAVGAVSVSALAFRLPLDQLVSRVPEMIDVIEEQGATPVR
jgi:DNA-binding IclR family transcriptional regulator